MVMAPFARVDEVMDETRPGSVSHRVRKQAWDPQQQRFCEQVYVRVNCLDAQSQQLERWLADQFGPPRYHGAWWRQRMSTRLMGIWMREDISTFWFLTQT